MSDEENRQQVYLLNLRYAIDTAITYPSKRNREEAMGMIERHPETFRSSHVQHNLGKRRKEWIAIHQTYGTQTVKMDITT